MLVTIGSMATDVARGWNCAPQGRMQGLVPYLFHVMASGLLGSLRFADERFRV